MNWRKQSIRGFKRRKPTYPAVPVKHSTASSSYWPLMFTMVVIAAFFIGFYTGCVLLTAQVYGDCATKGHWTWKSKLLLERPDVTCQVPKGMAFETTLTPKE